MITRATITEAEAKFDQLVGKDYASSYSRSLAIEALAQDRPAFHSLASYYNQTAFRLMDMANQETLSAAVEKYCDETWTGKSRREQLELVVPLNALAHAALGAELNKIEEFQMAAE